MVELYRKQKEESSAVPKPKHSFTDCCNVHLSPTLTWVGCWWAILYFQWGQWFPFELWSCWLRQFNSITVMVRVWVRWRKSRKHLLKEGLGLILGCSFLALEFLIKPRGSRDHNWLMSGQCRLYIGSCPENVNCILAPVWRMQAV